MAITPNQFLQIFKEKFDKIIYDQYKRLEPIYPQIYNTITAEGKLLYRAIIYEPLVSFSEVGMGEKPSAEVDITKVRQFDIVRRKYGTTVVYPAEWDLIKGEIEVFKNIASKIADRARLVEEKMAADIFVKAFTSNPYNPNGEPLCGTHTLVIAGTTYSNLVSGSLSPTTLNQAITIMSLTPNEQGDIVSDFSAQYLVVPPSLEFAARQILQSEHLPWTANLGINPLQNKLQLIVWKFLPDDGRWFVLAEKGSHTLTFVNFGSLRAAEPIHMPGDKFLAEYYMNIGAGFYDWRGVVGSTGA